MVFQTFQELKVKVTSSVKNEDNPTVEYWANVGNGIKKVSERNMNSPLSKKVMRSVGRINWTEICQLKIIRVGNPIEDKSNKRSWSKDSCSACKLRCKE